MGERNVRNVEVVGSIPIISTSMFKGLPTANPFFHLRRYDAARVSDGTSGFQLVGMAIRPMPPAFKPAALVRYPLADLLAHALSLLTPFGRLAKSLCFSPNCSTVFVKGPGGASRAPLKRGFQRIEFKKSPQVFDRTMQQIVASISCARQKTIL